MWHTDQFGLINVLVCHKSTENKRTHHQLVIPCFVYTQLGVHAGACKTLHLLRRCFYWVEMYSDTGEFVRNCVNCQQAEVVHTNKPETGRAYVPYLPMEILAIDILAVGRPGSLLIRAPSLG